MPDWYALRDALASDLHDDVIQALYALGLDLTDLVDADRAERERRLSRARATLSSVITDVRVCLDELTQPPRGALGAVLRRRVETLVTTRPRPIWTVDTVIHDTALTRQQTRLAYLSLRELIANVHRHADAGHALLRLHDNRAWLIAQVEDDGRGFVPDQVSPNAVGLASIRTWVGELGGTVRFDSRPGAGTRVAFRFPLIVPEDKRRLGDHGPPPA